MFDNWATIVFGWPAVATALLTFTLAVSLNSRGLAVVAALVSAPFCLCVSGDPVIRGLGWVALGLNVAGVVALWRRQRFASAMLWSPFAMLAGAVAILSSIA